MLSIDTINQPMLERMRPLREKRSKDSLLIHEIYPAIQGETSMIGLPCVLVRTTGCHLRCSYCDTEHAFFKGALKSLDEVIKEVSTFGIKFVSLTGGEPLLQEASFTLLEQLINNNFIVSVETSGAVSIKNIHRKVKVILDIKTPDSLEDSKNVWSNLNILWPGCEVKFVLSSIKDYEYAKKICQQYDLYNRTQVLFSPVVNLLEPTMLVENIMKDRLPVRFQMQLHRILYGEAPGY